MYVYTYIYIYTWNYGFQRQEEIPQMHALQWNILWKWFGVAMLYSHPEVDGDMKSTKTFWQIQACVLKCPYFHDDNI